MYAILSNFGLQGVQSTVGSSAKVATALGDIETPGSATFSAVAGLSSAATTTPGAWSYSGGGLAVTATMSFAAASWVRSSTGTPEDVAGVILYGGDATATPVVNNSSVAIQDSAPATITLAGSQYVAAYKIEVAIS